ncbi:MAG: tyrosine recombinase [Dehalococcoidia bacterium]|nr:tyrosine recombinase [Dehalococcoidia bacterium]|tara:strand:- start:20065 stop:20997 length:933 start_codon:yes stop_codon:yes gene_type:complete
MKSQYENITKYIDEFLRHLISERGFSPETIKAYRIDLYQFSSKVAGNSGCTTIEQVDKKVLETFALYLRNSGNMGSTVARKMASVRAFFRFLTEDGIIPSNPSQSLRVRRVPANIPEVLSEHQIVQLLSAIDSSTPEGARDRTMLELTYAAGLRVSEIVGPKGLKLSSVRFDDSEIIVVGKGSKERLVPLYPQIIDRLSDYVKTSRLEMMKKIRKKVTTDSLFLNAKSKPLSRQGFWLILQKYALLSGLNTKVYPHILRHSFATHLLRGGASLRHVQELLGHATIASTQIYTHISDDQVQETFNKAHPRS